MRMLIRTLRSRDDDILCLDCEGPAETREYRWFTVKDRVDLWPKDESMSEFRLPCGHTATLFSDVIPLRGHFVRRVG